MTEPEAALLARLGERCGVLPGYHDIWGRHHAATPEDLREVLRAMGVDVSGPEALERELREREAAPAERLLEPFTLLPEGQDQLFRLSVPAVEADWAAQAHLKGRA
ncbi:MAG: hypothetical protein IH608_00545, partial [Proteobacteria bacterium]|nr:hypothetical protein [Pseudomonadota bacterium]